ncbi:hypothetical protein pb186bvf_020330 [Paramecium bursaria]
MDQNILRFDGLSQDQQLKRIELIQSGLGLAINRFHNQDYNQTVSQLIDVQMNAETLQADTLMQATKALRERLKNDLTMINNKFDILDKNFFIEGFLNLLKDFRNVINLYNNHYRANVQYILQDHETYLRSTDAQRIGSCGRCLLI